MLLVCKADLTRTQLSPSIVGKSGGKSLSLEDRLLEYYCYYYFHNRILEFLHNHFLTHSYQSFL